MQTFLPYPDFAQSAKVLDRSRLGKQRVETYQIMKALLMGQGWIHHPATKMWRGYEFALLRYQSACVNEWRARGYADTCMPKTLNVYFRYREDGDPDLPWWLGNTDFHLSHQSNLLRKDPDYYGLIFPEVPDDLPYVWPT